MFEPRVDDDDALRLKEPSQATKLCQPPPDAHGLDEITVTVTDSGKATRSENNDPLALIESCKKLTAYRKRVLSLLCQVPAGKYTTYAALSRAICVSSPPDKPTCARAVGSAMRNNPFAPLVPCHRVLATGGRIGGFGGQWGDDGAHAGKKRALLRAEGVRFDGKGRVVGAPFTKFVVQ